MKTQTLLRAGAGLAALAAAGTFVHMRTALEERRNRPAGRFVTVDGVRLHYVEEGDGPPLVLLHGLGTMAEDFQLSGLVREAAKRYRVIAFDRPGYGYSERPKRWRFGPSGQATLLRGALRMLGVQRPIVLGHSWGTLVAVAFALEHPGAARSLVLESGLYFPSLRPDALLYGPPALPLIGDLMRHTVSPLLGRAMWPALVKTLFAPAPVAATFRPFSAWMAQRPGQLRADAEEALLTLPTTLRFARRYRRLTLPVIIVAGRRDRYVHTRAHSERLHAMLPTSRMLVSETAGHMVHHTDLPIVLEAIDAAAWPVA